MTDSKKPRAPRTPRAAGTRTFAGKAPAKPRAPRQPRTEQAVDETRFDDVISGAYDIEAPEIAAQPEKRVLQPHTESPKLHKVLAQAGMGSRLEMERMIGEGRITVNNEPAHVGQRIQLGDSIKVDGKPVRVSIAPPVPRVIAYHKPVGELVTHDDPQNRPTVFRTLPRLNQGKWQSVGRLDLNTEGLLLITNSGELANQLMHPSFGLQREYAVRVLGALSEEEKTALLDGVQLEDGVAQFGSIEEGGGEGANHWYRVTISEGRNREVRRMFEAVGHAVSRLIRIRYGILGLPRGLRRGAWMELGDKDIKALMDLVGMKDTSRLHQQERQTTLNRRRSPDRGAGGKKRATSSNTRGMSSREAAIRASGSKVDPAQTSAGYLDGRGLRRGTGGKTGGGGRSAPAQWMEQSRPTKRKRS